MTPKPSIITALIHEGRALAFSRNNESWLYNKLAVNSVEKIARILNQYSFTGKVEIRFKVEEITLHCKPANPELNMKIQDVLDMWQPPRKQ